MARPQGRAIAVAGLLRQGWTAGAVSAMLEITDRGGSQHEALDAGRKAQGEPAGTRLSALRKREGESDG